MSYRCHHKEKVSHVNNLHTTKLNTSLNSKKLKTSRKLKSSHMRKLNTQIKKQIKEHKLKRQVRNINPKTQIEHVKLRLPKLHTN